MTIAAATPASMDVDHLVVACRTLAAGRDWCERTFGVAPAPGGRHPLMGTHNLLLAVASPRCPRAYLELIAIDPDAPSPGRPRWFDLDDPALQAAIATEPRLVHWVARSVDLGAAVAALRAAGVDAGPVVDAERITPRGPLRWRIAIPADGRRHGAGAVPLLIAWGEVHPSDDLPPCGVALQDVVVAGIDPALAASLGVTFDDAPDAPPLAALFWSPGGPVRLACA